MSEAASESIGVADVGASGGRVSTLTRRAGPGRDRFTLVSRHDFTHPLHEFYQADRHGVARRRTFWNPQVVYEGMLEGLCRSAAGGDRNLVSFGIDSWGSDGLWLSPDGDPIFPACCSHCERFTEIRAEIEAASPGRERYRRTGVYPNDFLVLNQVYWASRKMPEMVAAAGMFMPLVSLYNYWLSGMRAVEFTWLTTGHLGSVPDAGYCEDTFARLHLPRDKMPPLRRPGETLGFTPKGLAESLGFAPFRILLPSNHDTACAYAAASVPPGRTVLTISAGTWWCMGASLPEPVITDETFAGKFSNVGGLEGVVLNVINMGSLPAQALKRAWEREDSRAWTWEDYNRLAAEGYRPGMTFDIDDPRLANTPDMKRTLWEVAGMPAGSLWRGGAAALVYVGLAEKAARLAGVLGGILGRAVEEILVIGGGARNDLLNQWIADRSGLPVRTGPANATTLGNALAQAVALGWFSSLEEGREALRGLWEEKVFLPNR